MITAHAYEGMLAEALHIKMEHVFEAIESPDKEIKESGVRKQVMKWIGSRTILVYYEEWEDEIRIVGVSATKRRIA